MSDEPPWEEPKPRGMNTAEKVLASRVYTAIQRSAHDTERGQQARQFRAGVSDLGYCSERLRRMLDQQHPDETDMLLAWIGTWLGEGLEESVVANFPGALRQIEVMVPLVGDSNTYNVPGHIDLLLPEEGIVLDGKTAYGLALARRMGPDQQKQFQRHCYAKGAWLAGYFGDRPLAEVQVGNVWIDRSGAEKGVHVQLEPYDEGWVTAAGTWLDEVVYAFVHKTEAQKEPPREVCASTCGFFPTCRALDTDVQGLLTDPTVLMAVEVYAEGKDSESLGKRLKAEAKAALSGISGSTGKHTVRWVYIEGTDNRSGHWRLDIRAIK